MYVKTIYKRNINESVSKNSIEVYARVIEFHCKYLLHQLFLIGYHEYYNDLLQLFNLQKLTKKTPLTLKTLMSG